MSTKIGPNLAVAVSREDMPDCGYFVSVDCIRRLVDGIRDIEMELRRSVRAVLGVVTVSNVFLRTYRSYQRLLIRYMRVCGT